MKKVLSTLLVLALLFGIFMGTGSSIKAEASGATNLKYDAGVKKICKYVNEYVALMYNWHPKKKNGKVDVTKGNKLNVTCLSVSSLEDGSVVDFEDNLKLGKYFALKTNKIKKYYRNLFGESLNVSKVHSTKYVKKKNGKLYVGLGDWGAMWPVYKIKNVENLSGGKYRVTVEKRWKSDEGNIDKDGIIKITIKKSNNSNYGYVIKGIAYHLGKDNANRPEGTTLKAYKVYKSFSIVGVVVKPQRKNTSGYQIEYSTHYNMSGSKRESASNSKSIVFLKGLKPKTKYYLRVRTYRLSGSGRIYSEWSRKYYLKTKGSGAGSGSSSSTSSGSRYNEQKKQYNSQNTSFNYDGNRTVRITDGKLIIQRI